MGIKPFADARGANIVFLNNTIAEAENGSLLISKIYPAHERKVLGNKFNIVCDCNLKNTFKYLMGKSEDGDYYDEATYQAVIEKSECQKYKKIGGSYENINEYHSKSCNLPIPLPIIISASTVALAIIIIIIVCVVCNRHVQKAKEEVNYLGECYNSQSFSTLHSTHGPHSVQGYDHPCQSWDSGNNIQQWVVAVPEVRTYQETEVDVHYEHTEPMTASIRDSYPIEPRLDILRKSQARSSCPFN